MQVKAIWLSRQEEVEVEGMLSFDRSLPYREPCYRVRRFDGSVEIVHRKDILLEDELRMVSELADILKMKQLKSRNERYADIMRDLLRRGAPFSSRLRHQISANEQLELFDDAG